jgi:peptidoglycan hydrolase-like protein with peptidoglycan-binding domain
VPGCAGRPPGSPPGPQSNGPRVAALQAFLRDRYSLYAKGLTVDGWYGQQTAGVLAEFAHRSGIPSADGLNIGPKLAAALTAAGFEQRTAARPTSARDRVRGHLDRTARR